jgi:hypothetical protein
MLGLSSIVGRSRRSVAAAAFLAVSVLGSLRAHFQAEALRGDDPKAS